MESKNVVLYYTCLKGITSPPGDQHAAGSRRATRQQGTEKEEKGRAEAGLPDLIGEWFTQAPQLAGSLLDMDRWEGFLHKLCSFNRYSLGPGIKDAKDWVVETLSALPDLHVAQQEFTMTGSQHVIHNVIATLAANPAGKPMARQDPSYIVIGAHYDSISEDAMNIAPGAVDNASGTAAVIEMAHIFCQLRKQGWHSRYTVLFILYAGEEQGYKGSEWHIGEMSSFEKAWVKFMLNMDMIAWRNPQGTEILVETLPKFRWLFPLFEAAAKKFTTMPISRSESPWGSDHMPYLKR